MLRLLIPGLVGLLFGVAVADDARQLRLEAAVLIQNAENVHLTEDRKALLEKAYRKLLEIQERYPSASTELLLYLGGRSARLTPDDVLAKIATISLATFNIGKLRNVLGRPPNPIAADENGWTDLHYAAALNLPELVKGLLDAGANVSAQIRDDGKPPSDSLKRSLEVLELRSDFSCRGYTPLHMAALHNARKVLPQLLGSRADIEANGKDGITPLHTAAYANAGEMVGDLIASGADIHASNTAGGTPLHYAASGNAVQAAAALIVGGAKIDAKGKDGWTPLHNAASVDAAEVAVVLIESGADIRSVTRDGKTPLDIAEEWDSLDVGPILRQSGIETNDTIETYLRSAVRRVGSHIRYPKHAERDNLSGRVLLQFIVLRNGRVINPRVPENAGPPVFRDATLAALKQAGHLPPLPSTIHGNQFQVAMLISYHDGTVSVEPHSDEEVEITLTEDQGLARPSPSDTRRDSSITQSQDEEAEAIQSYLGYVLWTLERRKRYPEYARLNGLNGRVVLRFTVRSDGSIVSPEVAESTGHFSFGHGALQDLRRIGRLPPFPPGIRRRELLVEVPISYRTE